LPLSTLDLWGPPTPSLPTVGFAKIAEPTESPFIIKSAQVCLL